MLAAEGIKCRVVSAPSEGLFRDQSEEYQQSVLPEGIIRYGMTSGIASTIRGLVGDKGRIHSLDHFGYSAPAKRLEQEFGYSGEVVYREVKEFLGK
jgi:transketolase